jgi:hypothetical protein
MLNRRAIAVLVLYGAASSWPRVVIAVSSVNRSTEQTVRLSDIGVAFPRTSARSPHSQAHHQRHGQRFAVAVQEYVPGVRVDYTLGEDPVTVQQPDHERLAGTLHLTAAFLPAGRAATGRALSRASGQPISRLIR